MGLPQNHRHLLLGFRATAGSLCFQKLDEKDSGKELQNRTSLGSRTYKQQVITHYCSARVIFCGSDLQPASLLGQSTAHVLFDCIPSLMATWKGPGPTCCLCCLFSLGTVRQTNDEPLANLVAHRSARSGSVSLSLPQ